MLKNQEIIKLIQTKEKSIKDQMNELTQLYEIGDIKTYRNFNNVFISSVKSLLIILSSNTKGNTILNSNETEMCINGQKESEENFKILTKFDSDIVNFIKEMIDKFTQRSEMTIGLDSRTDDMYIEYKYMQQIIDDYIKLLIFK